MDIQISESIAYLKACIDTNRTNDAAQHIENIEHNFEANLSNSEIDLNLNILFNGTNGLIAFLWKTIKLNKTFKDSNVQIFTLISKLIVQHKAKFQQYSKITIEVCLKYILSTSVTAKEKEKAVQLLQELVLNKLCADVDISNLLQELIRVVNLKNPTARFLQYTYELLGMLARDFPECMLAGNDKRIRDLYFNTLETKLLKIEDFSFYELTGALQGFNYYLVTCAPSKSEEPQICQRIYVCVKKLSDPGDITRRSAFRSALNLLANHGSLFSEQLFNDNQYWHTVLLNWLKLSSWEDRKTAIYALHTLHREIARMLQLRNNPNDINILKFFINYFKTTLQLAQSQSYEIRIAICGFGVMAEPCKTLLPPEYLNNLLMLVIQRTEYAILENRSINKDNLEYFPDFVQALSQIMKQINELTGIQMSSLENIIVVLIKEFHFLSTAHHSLVVNSLISTFYNLSRLGETILNDLLEKIILQGVIWTCSHKLLIEANIDWENITDWKENTTYKFYLPLWNGLLTMNNVEYNNVDQFTHRIIIRKIYEYLMKSLFTILDKLDLSTTKRIYKDSVTGEDQDLYFCDPNYDLMPSKPKDFHIFFNLIDFYMDLLGTQTIDIHRENFQQWIYIYCETIISKSIKYPLISGFIKLLKIGLNIGNKIGYFNELTVDRNLSICITNRDFLFDNLIYFLKNIILKCQQSTGELQLSCLQLLFTVPIILIKDIVIDLIPIFHIGFDIGKSMLSIAHMALTSLENITELITNYTNNSVYAKYFSINPNEQFLIKVLPCLDPYLQTKGFLIDKQIDIEIIKFKKSLKAKRVYKQIDGDSELLKLQRRIMLYLGTLEPKNCLHLISSEKSKENLIKWDVEQNIRLTLHFKDMETTIYLDALIPRICTLAITSSDRKTKIAATELVHGIILYLIGTNNHSGKIWIELCNHMLDLATDSDIAVKQMFEPLIIQITHYLSQSSQILGIGVQILLDCLLEGISNKSNTSIRDLSARCIREFLTWCVKHTTRAQLDASAVNFNILISKLKLYCFHSCNYKRFGAALAFNNLYRIFREEDALINMYALDLLYMYCINFQLTNELNTHHTDKINLEQVSLCLDHVVRMIRERKNLLNQSDTRRIKPLPFDGGDTLKDAILWLLTQCSSKKQYYREKCINLYMQLAPCVNDMGNSAVQFFKQTQTIESIIKLCEGADNDIVLLSYPTLSFIQNINGEPSLALPLIYTWFEHFLTSIDCHIWLLGDGFISDAEIVLQKSTLFNVIQYYMEDFCLLPGSNIISKLEIKLPGTGVQSTLNFNIEMVDKIETIKCTTLLRIMEFIVKILPNNKQWFPLEFWSIANSRNIIDLILHLIFHPQDLGLNNKNKDTIGKITQQIEILLITLLRHSPSSFSNELQFKLSFELLQRYDKTINTAEEYLSSDSVPVKQINSVKGIELLCKQIKKYGILFSVVTVDDIEKIHTNANKLLQHLFDGLKKKIFTDYYPVRPSPTIKRYANQLINICFLSAIKSSSSFFDNVIDLMLNNAELKIENSAIIKHGNYFTDIYKLSIFEYLLNTYEISLGKLIIKMTTTNIVYIINILINFMEYLYKHKQYDKMCLQSIVTILLEHCSNMLEIVNANKIDVTIQFLFIEYISNIAMICPFQLNRIGEMASGLQPFLLTIIDEPENSIKLKSRAIFLIPCICGPDQHTHEALTKTLYNLHSQYFPIKSAEFIMGSLERSAFCNTFQMLLDALVISQSSVLLTFLINITISDDKHILEYAIQDAIEKFMKNQMDTNRQVHCLTIPFNIFEDMTLEPTIRLTVIKRYLLSMIRHSYVESIIIFYTNKIKRILEMTETNYALANAGWNVEHALVNRIGAYQLIEILFGTVKRETLQNCSIGTAALTGADKSAVFFGVVTKKPYSARNDIFVTDDLVAAEYFRQYQCAAYNALCAIICNTQIDLKYYTIFLFKELPTENKLIWQKLINTKDDNLYVNNFPQIFDEYPKIKQRVVSIRQTAVDTTDGINTNSATSNKSKTNVDGRRRPIKYIQSQNIFDSSLSQDVTKLDLNFSNVRTTAEVAALENVQDTVSIPLEKLTINTHEIMATLCAVIKHMYDNKITPISEDPTKIRKAAPKWVELICNIIVDTRQPKNIRLFLGKVIENCRHIFCNYAAVVTKPIMQLLVDECAGNTLNCYVIDMIVMLIEWNTLYKIESNEECHLASDLFKFCMKNVWFDRKEIFRRNLEICKCLLEIWKEQIVVPKQFLFDSINKSNRTEARDNLCGIQLNAIILANNLIPWTDDTLCVYFRLLYQCLENEYTSIYQPTSQLLGMCLAHIQSLLDDDNNRNEQIHNIYAELINILTTLKFKNDKKFTDIIYGIQKYYPKIIDSFLLIISNYITNSSGALKRIYLEMFLARCDTYEHNVYREILAIGIKDLLKMKEFKLLALHIINKTISKMNAIDIAAIFNDIKLFVNDENQLCRDVTYEIFIYIHEHIDDDGHTNTIDGISLRKQTTTLLLNGLSDSDLQIQNRIFKFWSNEINLPLKPDERILKLFGELYDSNSEKYFLSFCTQLLLEPAIQEPYAKRQIFEHETVTTDSKLHEYDINLSWRKQNSLLMAPLFTETNQDQVISDDFSNQQFLRATLSEVAFEPTHDPVKILQTPNNFTLQSHNSLLFQIQSQVLDRRSNRITEFNQQQQHHYHQHQHQQQQHQYEQKNSNESNILNKLRKRFISDRDTISKNMAYKAIEKHKYELDVQSVQKKQKEGHVTLFRRYRYGDYPDLLINNLALLLPLQGLVKRDPILSRKVLVSIFTSIVTELNPSDSNSFMATTSQYIETIFNNTKTCDSLVFSTLIEIALINPKIFIISPQIISMIANANQMMPIGILYIENRLNYMNDEDDENDTAKISTTSIAVEEQHWLELSNLYLSLSEYDVVGGIFSDKLKTDHVLGQAIEYETNGNYLMAQKFYLETIHKQRPVEEDFAYRSYFKCLELMANWSLLSKYTKDQITDNNMEEFWTDNWNKEILLPHYIKSNLYLILDGKRELYTLEFLRTMTDWMGNTEKSQYVEQTFGEELMMLEITNKNYLQARVHSEQHLMRLLSEWPNLSILSNKVRTEKLLNIRKVSEIYKFTELLLSLTSAATTTTTTAATPAAASADLPDIKKLEKFVNNLTYSRPELSDSTLLWNCITSYRRYICLLIMNQLKNHIDSNSSVKQLYKSFTNCIFDMNFNVLKISLDQKNIQLASKFLYSLSDYENKENDIKSLEWTIAKSKQQKLKSRLSTDANVAMQLLLKSWQTIDTILLNNIHINNFIENYPDIYIDALNEIVLISSEISMRYQNENVNIQNYTDMIFERTSTSKNSNIDIRMHEHSLNCLQKCIKILKDNIETKDRTPSLSGYVKHVKNIATLGRAYYNLAQYIYDSHENQRLQKCEFLEKTLILSVFNGMRFNSKECRQMFPLLLQLPNLINNNLKESFDNECGCVPEWMFLEWIPQILSRFDFLNICFIDKLLNRISIAYPSAIIYPFQLSYNQYKTKHSQHMDRELIRQIQKRINIPIVMDFIKALNYLCLPEKMIEHYIRDIYSSCGENCLERINNALRIVYGDDKEFQGKAYDRIQKYKTILEEAKLYANDFSKVISILQPHLTINISSSIENSTTLESLSPWLHKFQWHPNDVGIEIPGQYCGTKCPNINNHIKIVKFDERLKIHKSKRKPIEFIIHGSNTKTYNFIIKYGEDLRQDQRIQQLLTLMNNQLQNDKNCCQNNLFLNTFNIIPLNYYCGMIECFDNTKTAQEVISKCMARRLPNSKAIIGNLYVEYGKFLSDAVKDKTKKTNESLHRHGKAVVHYTREKIMSKFQELQYKIPQNILKLALTDICVSPESFFALRNNFATSLATMSIAHWILGIGDRHLSNMLFNMENGSVIGIDFGLTFGAGTRDLNIPEMLPFRLTPQFVNTMNPLGTSGFISKCMIHVLRALRANSKLLIACMDVFVHEPTIDWLESARVKAIDNYDNVSLSSSDSIWDPNVRIKMAKNKLNGINPKAVFMEDLSMSSILAPYPEYIQGYKNILNGHPQHNVRAQLDSHGLTVEQQVSCLIDMATDPALLGLCYEGFQPWI